MFLIYFTHKKTCLNIQKVNKIANESAKKNSDLPLELEAQYLLNSWEVSAVCGVPAE